MSDNFPNGVALVAIGNILRGYFPDVDEAEVKECEAVIAEKARLAAKPKWLEVLHLIRAMETQVTLNAVVFGENGHLAIEPEAK